ncbi:TPA: hypothetical protein DCW54_00280, partial [Candidatus Dependentiae bacterium]|nr:hypothetical protein [Candidatus Dependentiae bacterium]
MGNFIRHSGTIWQPRLLITLIFNIVCIAPSLFADMNIVVSKNAHQGGFTSIKDALEYSQKTAKHDERVFVLLDKGIYEEEPLLVRGHVTLDGGNARDVIIRAKDQGQDLITSAGLFDVQGINFEGATGPSVAAIRVVGGVARVAQCRFGNNDTFIAVTGEQAKARAIVEDIRVDGTARFSYGFVLLSDKNTNVLELDRIAWTNQSDVSPKSFVAVSGERSDLIARSLAISDTPKNQAMGIYAYDGALISVEDSLFQNLHCGIFVPRSNQSPSLVVTRCVGVGNSYDLFVEDPDCTGIVSTCFDEKRIELASEKVFVSFDSPFGAETRAFTLPATDIKEAIDAVQAATALNTPSTLVERDASGNFVAGTITAALTGAASANVLKAGDTMTGNLILDNQSQLQLREETLSGTDSVSLQAPDALPASYTLTLPDTAGTNGYALTTNGSGVLGWTEIATAANTILQGGNSFGAAMTVGTNDTYDLNLETDGTTRMTITSAGAVSTAGALTSGGALTVSAGGAAVTGNSTVTGTLGVSSDFAVATDKFTVAAASGNTAVGGTLTSAGA